MKRRVDFNEISDGRKYSSSDLVKTNCADCAGCSECCHMIDTILLDPYDIFMLKRALSMSFEQMLSAGIVELNVHEGLILPNLGVNPATGKCKLLSDAGRCTVHAFRPGFCRLFPMGRIYEDDGTFFYFLQVHECPYPNKTKIKVSKWLGIENLSRYEEYIRSWHQVQNNVIASCRDAGEEMGKRINLGFLRLFYMSDYDTSDAADFYEQYEKRKAQLD